MRINEHATSSVAQHQSLPKTNPSRKKKKGNRRKKAKRVSDKSSHNNKNTFSKQAISNLSAKDRRLFQTFGQGETVPLPFTCIHRAIEAQIAAQPKAIAAEHLGESITYEELDFQARKLAMLLAENGVKRGDNVGIFIKRSIPMLVGILATLKLGAAYVPQDIRIRKAAQLSHIIDAAAIKVALTLSEYKEKVPANKNLVCLAIDEVMQATATDKTDQIKAFVSNPDTTGDHRCFILFTSGTTGQPNGVQVIHKNVCNILLTKPGNMGMRPGYKVAQLLNIGFDMAAWEILGCLSHGATLVIRGKDFTETAKQADVIIATPSVLNAIDATQCTQAKQVAVAGEPCPIPLANKWAAFCNFYNACGPTETTIVNTMQLCKPNANHITIGKPTPNNTVYVLDENKQPCAIGKTGVMWAGGLCVTAGYIGNDKLNKERYAPDPFLNDGSMMFRTGDLGRWTKNGQLEHLGRMDDQVKVRGFRVELDAVSGILESAPNCKRAVTLKLDDQNLVSFVSPASVDTDTAKQKVSVVLPYYATPTFVIGMDSFPITARGKIDKRALLVIAKEKQNTEKKTPSEKPDGKDHEDIDLPPQQVFWKRIWKHPTLMPYHRLFALVAIVNLIVFANGWMAGTWWTGGGVALGKISNLVLINFSLAILIRQQYVINFLFKIATSIPISWPLSIRWAAGKVYHFGGLHSGASSAGTVWFLFFTGGLIYNYNNSIPDATPALLAVSLAMLILLVLMIIMALPQIRAHYHNNFEFAHRFGGWTVLFLFWTQMLLFIAQQNGGHFFSTALFSSPDFWMLSILTISIILPWTRLKKVPVKMENPSSHVVLANFNYGVTPFAGSSTAISRNPLLEWHSFANVPAPGKDGFRLTISRAGDWTGKLIDDKPSHLWVKGIPTAGVGNIDKLFKRVIWVATGSGIGPCLPHLLSKEVSSRLVWATRNPKKTYGDKLVNEILSVQPDPIIWDTQAHGKPDMVKLAYQAYQEFEAEAVICISNKKLTYHVVHQLESRGIPAFGAIWDS